jgi:hypothetical protein
MLRDTYQSYMWVVRFARNFCPKKKCWFGKNFRDYSALVPGVSHNYESLPMV